MKSVVEFNWRQNSNVPFLSYLQFCKNKSINTTYIKQKQNCHQSSKIELHFKLTRWLFKITTTEFNLIIVEFGIELEKNILIEFGGGIQLATKLNNDNKINKFFLNLDKNHERYFSTVGQMWFLKSMFLILS